MRHNKKRQTNLQLLKSLTEEISEQVERSSEKETKIPVVNKIKKGRGPPKKALINTKLLLTS